MTFWGSIIEGILSPVTNTLTAIFNKKEDTSLEKFRVQGNVDLSLVQAHVQLEQSRNEVRKSAAVQTLILLFGLPLAFYYGKILVWDAALHLGVTDAVKGDVATWNMMVVTFLFGASALQSWSRKT